MGRFTRGAVRVSNGTIPAGPFLLFSTRLWAFASLWFDDLPQVGCAQVVEEGRCFQDIWYSEEVVASVRTRELLSFHFASA
jgi:hypothetical protein